MSDCFVTSSGKTKDGIVRPHRKDAKKNRAIKFTAHESVSIKDKEDHRRSLEVRPGMVVTALLTYNRNVMMTRQKCLENSEMLAHYYVLELISASDAETPSDNGSDAIDALVLRVKEARAVMDDEGIAEAGLQPDDLIFTATPKYIDVDLFIDVLNVVKDRREPGRLFLAACCNCDSTDMIPEDHIFVKDIITNPIKFAPVLAPAADVAEFFTEAALQHSEERSAEKKRKQSIVATGDSAAADAWACKFCTFENDFSLWNCEVCDAAYENQCKPKKAVAAVFAQEEDDSEYLGKEEEEDESAEEESHNESHEKKQVSSKPYQMIAPPVWVPPPNWGPAKRTRVETK